MYHMMFECDGKRVFSIRHKNYPLPRTGDLVTYNTDHYEVKSVRHMFVTDCHGDSTGIKINMIRKLERDILEA